MFKKLDWLYITILSDGGWKLAVVATSKINMQEKPYFCLCLEMGDCSVHGDRLFKVAIYAMFSFGLKKDT